MLTRTSGARFGAESATFVRQAGFRISSGLPRDAYALGVDYLTDAFEIFGEFVASEADFFHVLFDGQVLWSG